MDTLIKEYMVQDGGYNADTLVLLKALRIINNNIDEIGMSLC